MRINLFAFRGRIPSVSDRLLPDNNATIAKDCDLRSGEIRPFHDKTLVQSLGSSKWGTIHKWRGNWLLFEGAADVVNSPVIDDVWQRICFTSDKLEQPMMAYNGIIPLNGEMQGVGYKLGVPAPTGKITPNVAQIIEVEIDAIYHERPFRIKTKQPHGLVTYETVQFDIRSEAASGSAQADNKKNDLSKYLNEGIFQITASPDKPDEFTLNNTDAANIGYSEFIDGKVQQYFAPGNLDAVTYVFTYVSDLGEEGPNSDNSEIVRVGATQVVTLALPSLEADLNIGRNITKKRIYRAVTGSGSALFLFVGEVDLSETTFTDDILTNDLGEALQSYEYDPPDENMKGLRITSQGFGVGFYDNVVCFSEPYLPHAWPTSYQIPVEHEIVALEVIDNGVVVGTKGRPYIIRGLDPRSMVPKKLEDNYACLSKESMASLGYAVVYATTQGLVLVQGGQSVVVTKGLLTEKDWAKYEPKTIKGFAYNDMYIAFYGEGASKGGFIFNPKSAEIGLIDISDWARNGFIDPEDKYLYLLDNSNNIIKWNDDESSKIDFDWQSKDIASIKPINMSCAKVKAENYPVTFELYGDGVLRYTKEVQDENAFVLPKGYLCREWNIRLTGTANVQDVQVSDSYEELE